MDMEKKHSEQSEKLKIHAVNILSSGQHAYCRYCSEHHGCCLEAWPHVMKLLPAVAYTLGIVGLSSGNIHKNETECKEPFNSQKWELLFSVAIKV